ncbi:MAG TPA: secretin N-terminal domain-containing protein [Burkholderiales bacterium]|jgi:general secretion pathway protein D|nr:secretin N-terminal domain-containing protein [Burkholderiales bacterium]
MRKTAAALCTVFLVLHGCSQTPIQPADTHLRADPAPVEATIPAPVQIAPVLPPPRPAPPPETYTVVVTNVRAQDLLFALARDAKINVDIHPGITGQVTLNAIEQTLPQLLTRIARQIDLRYEIDGANLIVLRDTPFLRTYRIEYVSASRNVKMQSTSSTQFAAAASSAGSGGAGPAAQATGSTASVEVVSNNQLWEAIVQNVKEILRETDRIIPAGASPPPAPPPTPASLPAGTQVAPATAQLSEFREAASVIGNRESGLLIVRATSRQHERVQEFLDQVLASVKRQVLIEATVAEVQLNNQYQRGIDWSRIRRGASGVSLFGNRAGTPAGVDTSAFIIDAAAASVGFQATIRLLESFGDVRVLSSPKVSVLNNQTALLRVTRDIVYFTITPSSTPITVAGGSGNLTVQQAFTTTPNVAAEGFMMSVLPQISDTDAVLLNVRPTIRRRVAFAVDPNPALAAATPNLIPIFETRELDSILRMQSGQIAVLGGLMQDSVSSVDDTIPGVRQIPGLGQLFAQRKDASQKSELVIFLRASVIRDASVDGDYRRFRDSLPGGDFFLKPNPARSQAEPG